MSDHGLNPRQLTFARRILDGDCSHAQAAIDAGYAAGSAAVTASRVLMNANVRAYIEEKRAVTEEKTGISRERAAECMLEILEGRHREEGCKDSTGRIGAYNALAKTFGWNEPEKLEVSEGSWVDRIRQRSASKT